MPKRITLSALAALTGFIVGCFDSQSPDGGSEPPPDPDLEQLVHGGLERTYRIHFPVGGNATQPTPVVFGLHGGGSESSVVQDGSGFDAVADSVGFIVVYPNAALNRNWAEGCDCVRADTAGVDDVGFLLALVDEIDRSWSVDRDRVYAFGVSQGGFFAHRVACDAPERFAAVVVVMGAMSLPLSEVCTPSQPISVAMYMGTQDPTVLYAGNYLGGLYSTLSADSSLSLWAAKNGCTGDLSTWAYPDVVSDGWAVRVDEYPYCDQGTSVSLYSLIGAGHIWPRGDIDPALTITEFFFDRGRPAP